VPFLNLKRSAEAKTERTYDEQKPHFSNIEAGFCCFYDPLAT
jgi:hypothetical protein